MVQPAAPHRCRPVSALRVKIARGQGYIEVYHESERALANARASVVTRAGYQTMLEEAVDGWIVLARKA